MWVDYVEWDEEYHFSMGLTYDDLEAIINKGSLEDGHEDILMAALRTAWNRTGNNANP